MTPGIHEVHDRELIATPTSRKALGWILIIFLFLEYVRPPGIVDFRLQLVATLVLPIAFVFAKDRPWSSVFTAQILFLIVIAKSLPFAANNFSVYRITYVMVGYFAVFFAMAWLMSWRKPFIQITRVWLALVAYCAIYAIAHHGLGPGGYTSDENDLALLCVVALPFALFGFDYGRGRERWAMVFLGVVLVAAIVTSFSRGGFVGLALVGLHYFFASTNKRRAVFLAIAALLLFLILVPPEYFQEMETITGQENPEEQSTITGRFFLWTTAFEMWKAHPIMGVGAGNYPFEVGAYQPRSGDWPDFLIHRDWSGTTAHSVYFLVLAELGLPGLIIFMYLIWVHFRNSKRLRDQLKSRNDIAPSLTRDVQLYSRALDGAVIGFLASGAFLSVPYYPFFWQLTLMGAALSAAFHRECPVDQQEKAV
jgi:O-antigen ligase